MRSARKFMSACGAGSLGPPLDRSKQGLGVLVLPKPCGEGGFSLLEIVVVLALFGLIGALLIGGGGSLLQASARENAENTALTAIAAARHQAVLAGEIVEMNIDAKNRTLNWGAARAPLPENEELSLLPPVRSGAMLIGGQLKEEAIPRVRFYPDGTCDPFRLEISHDTSRRVIAIDPWTCAVLAADKKPGTF
jgi:prepilin-type N-terminal cleavage/methylation domain-containing protein